MWSRQSRGTLPNAKREEISVPEALRRRRAVIDRVLQHVVTGLIGEGGSVNFDRDELWILLDALPVAVLVSTDRECTRIWGNAAARQLYKLPPGQNFSRSSPEDELPPFEIFANGAPVRAQDLPLQKAASTGEPVAQSECEIRFEDGRRIFIAGHSIPVRNHLGEVCGSIGAFLDLTPQHRELQLSQLVAQEMSHRVRNTIGVIQAISRRMLRPLLPEQAYEAYEERLTLLAERQDLLSSSDGALLRLGQVVDAALADIFGLSHDRIRFSGPDLEIPAGCALPLSMILHELATNAVKYGALSQPGGTVAVAWSCVASEPTSTIRLTWVESGGPRVEPPSDEGFGAKMVAAAAASLPGGRVETSYAAAGVAVSVSFHA